MLMDEVEAAGVTLFGKLEDSLRLNVPRTGSAQAIQRKQHCDRRRELAFAGVNVLCFGDFWQLDPTGDTSFMSNPIKPIGNPCADSTMSMFWHAAREGDEHNTHLQAWQGRSRVWELSQSLRSGADKWFSEVLDQCRMGALEECNYNFLHGLPTNVPITFWFHRWGWGRQRVAPARGVHLRAAMR